MEVATFPIVIALISLFDFRFQGILSLGFSSQWHRTAIATALIFALQSLAFVSPITKYPRNNFIHGLEEGNYEGQRRWDVCLSCFVSYGYVEKSVSIAIGSLHW
jgi:hypothetical protein